MTDPNLVFDLKAKLDGGGFYDTFEIERVVYVDCNPRAQQSELLAALAPVVQRLQGRFKAASEAYRAAKARNDAAAQQATREEMDVLILFKGDMAAFRRYYVFLSQVYDYGNTDLEKRAIFFKHLIPQLEFGREREGVDLSKVVLTHHHLKSEGTQGMPLGTGESPKLQPITEAGSGSVQEKQKALLREIIQKVNELFNGDLTDDDKLVYVNNVLLGKLLESATLAQQAANNSKEQFGTSPDLKSELLSAVIAALDAHTAMSTQALNSEHVRDGLLGILLDHSGLWEQLRARGGR